MINHLKHDQIDKWKWDQTIKNSFNGMIYAYSWYLDIICPGWEALEKNDHEYVMPLTCGKKYGVEYIYPPFFAQQLGIFSNSKLDEKITDEFLNAIPPHYKYKEINLNKFNKYSGKDFSIKKNINHELDLIHPYEKLFKNYSENTQRNIKKAKKNNLEIIKDVAIKDLIKLFRSNRGKEVDAMKEKHYAILKALVDFSVINGSASTRGVINKKGELCAGAVFMRANDRIIFLFSGLSEEGKKAGAMFLLLDKTIQDHSELPFIFDFEGSNDKDLARFYKSFGSKESVYLQVKKNDLPTLLKWLKN